jgi:DNA gyrase subunit B
LYDDKALEDYRKKHSGFDIQRYKGLGEMSAEQLWETTMNPATRKLKQLTIEDGREASRLTSTLMGDDVPSRKAYIIEHADQALIDV